MKYVCRPAAQGGWWSHPARGAWIEICVVLLFALALRSHPARGAWIEIGRGQLTDALHAGRTPQGVRGLKCQPPIAVAYRAESHPARGAWIEIKKAKDCDLKDYSRTPQGVRGLK